MEQGNIINEPQKFSTNEINPPVSALFPNSKKPSFNRDFGKHDILKGEYKFHQQILAELIASINFVFGVCGCILFSGDSQVNAMLGPAFIGGVNIFTFGKISGAHFNPAVSLALFIRGKINFKKFILFVITQIIGGFIGCILIGLCRRGKFKEMAANKIADYLIYTAGGTKKNTWCYFSALFSEFFGTFALILFILSSCEKDNYIGSILGLCVSTTLIPLSVLGINISTFSINPIRSIAPAIVQAIAGGDKTPIKQLWIYIVGPMVGSALASFVWPIFTYQ